MNSDGYFHQYYRPGRRHDHHRRHSWATQKPGMPLAQSSFPEPCNPWAPDMMTMMGPPTSTPVMPVQTIPHGYQTPPPVTPSNPPPTMCEMSPPARQHYPGPYVWLLMIPIGYRADGTYGPLCPFPPFSTFPGSPCEEFCPYMEASGSYSPHQDQNFGQ